MVGHGECVGLYFLEKNLATAVAKRPKRGIPKYSRHNQIIFRYISCGEMTARTGLFQAASELA